ncbi:serine/threonine-protein kinase Sgk2-like [Rana temporaria]|uniref:serine/threonine-protein kinase Sgk2-like n=1 Tax=Rana temporaria TaxID=8407 RepID=UPI001AAD4DF5|nr:serine/threonine-protein kinase Sgk2-like [Rana temporaria]
MFLYFLSPHCSCAKTRKKDVANIKDHPFFNGINWEELQVKKPPPPFHIHKKNPETIQKNKMELEEITDRTKSVKAKDQEKFVGFSFVSEEWRTL